MARVDPHPPGPDDAAEITCVVADDHPALVQAICLLLDDHGIRVVGRANDGVAALAAIEADRPTVAILDVVMPRMRGTEVARRAGELAPETAVIIYTGFGDRELLVEALDAGARGFVPKEAPLDELVGAVRVAARGDVYVDPGLAAVLVQAGAAVHAPALSPREREILKLLAEGESNEQIGSALSIAPDTVRTYIRRAMQKLEADTRTQAVAIAIRQSIIS
jgi:DNA-binding NarL/FixJ family response regulator